MNESAISDYVDRLVEARNVLRIPMATLGRNVYRNHPRYAEEITRRFFLRICGKVLL
jgi:hypothetical protein